ncbi:hypothetical protein TWF102_005836 [Orbilia oligospora]|uniref:Uncharacterized protein n=1 Tax=Orbilia oligospora TaxID=2813651 RepID=A0A7C8NEL0_ORBOL|nr:hypothetical protein TWF706_007004 [Orbilia oligospora]KAF3112092.1 hypothetical protein TWF102_005836 [Orbilia oligospora]KAF3113326.1 hypothetical protein TWF103_002488 [Orbilia oligospora]
MNYNFSGNPEPYQDLEEDERVFRHLAETYEPIPDLENGNNDFPDFERFLYDPVVAPELEDNDEAQQSQEPGLGPNINRFWGNIGDPANWAGPREPEVVQITQYAPLISPSSLLRLRSSPLRSPSSPSLSPSSSLLSASSPYHSASSSHHSVSSSHHSPSSPLRSSSSPLHSPSSSLRSPSSPLRSTSSSIRSPFSSERRTIKGYSNRGVNWNPADIPAGAYDDPYCISRERVPPPPSPSSSSSPPPLTSYLVEPTPENSDEETGSENNSGDFGEEYQSESDIDIPNKVEVKYENQSDVERPVKRPARKSVPVQSPKPGRSGGRLTYTLQEKNFLIWAVGCPSDSPTLKFTSFRGGVERVDWHRISKALDLWMQERYPELQTPTRKPATLQEQWSRPEQVPQGRPKKVIRVKECWEALTNPSILNSTATPWDDTNELKQDRQRMDEWYKKNF